MLSRGCLWGSHDHFCEPLGRERDTKGHDPSAPGGPQQPSGEAGTARCRASVQEASLG